MYECHYFDKLKQLYGKMDNVVGDVIERFGDTATIMVMSDHGFNTFRRAVNVNTWLKNEGYITTDDDTCRSDYSMKDLQQDGAFWPGVDWSKSRAYSLGLGKIYLNVKGRESQGIVNPGREYEELRDEIINVKREIKF